jgi:hypothetical protein
MPAGTGRVHQCTAPSPQSVNPSNRSVDQLVILCKVWTCSGPSEVRADVVRHLVMPVRLLMSASLAPIVEKMNNPRPASTADIW